MFCIRIGFVYFTAHVTCVYARQRFDVMRSDKTTRSTICALDRWVAWFAVANWISLSLIENANSSTSTWRDREIINFVHLPHAPSLSFYIYLSLFLTHSLYSHVPPLCGLWSPVILFASIHDTKYFQICFLSQYQFALYAGWLYATR